MSAAAPSERVWTVLDLLRWTTEHFASKGIDSPRLDAEVLLAHALGLERLDLYLEFDKPVVEAERARFRELVLRRADERVPVAHLVGQREFWSLPLRVNRHVLVPRPDSETLVAAAVGILEQTVAERESSGVQNCEPIRILDLGTGSGALALALASEFPEARVFAVDHTQEALRLAQENAEALDMAARIRFVRSDWESALSGHFDCVVANPPYLAHAEREGLEPELAHEPASALYADADGLADLEHLARSVPPLLAPGGGLAFELASGQEGAVAGWLQEAGLETRVHHDLAGRPRVVSGRGTAAPIAVSTAGSGETTDAETN